MHRTGIDRLSTTNYNTLNHSTIYYPVVIPQSQLVLQIIPNQFVTDPIEAGKTKTVYNTPLRAL